MMEKTNDRPIEPEVFPPSMSTLDAAKRLGVTVPTIQRWLDQGVLRGWKTPGGHRRLAMSSVQAYIDSRMAGPAAAARNEPDILIIEDDPIYQELLRESLIEAMPKARIRFARDGFEGLAEVAADLPSCVITDIRMPHMDGVEMIRHLLVRHASLAGRVLVLSAGDGRELASLGVLRAAVSFLPKSTSTEVLRAAVAQLLQA
jgi:excisionase family DNA binding protein